MNKKTRIGSALLPIAMALFISAIPGDEVITRQGKQTTLNTTELTKKIRGYKGNTPVVISIKNNKIVKVEALKNHETPKYMAKAKAVLNQFTGKDVNKAMNMKTDAVTGATVTSKALIDNVKEGLKYYKKHK